MSKPSILSPFLRLSLSLSLTLMQWRTQQTRMTSLFRPSLLPRLRKLPIHPRITITKRYLGIPPAFLLDEYIPRYQLLTSVDAAKKRSLAYAHLRNCNLCPRKCGVNRYEETGVCLIGAETAKVNVIAPHRGEEPCIQGHHGSGSVFFSGCNLRCVFCQNHVRHSTSAHYSQVSSD